MWNGTKKIIWLLIGSTILSSVFSAFMLFFCLRIYNDTSFLKRKLSNSGDNAIKFQKYRKP
ncbi:hypothetical protein P4571_22780 [Niallia alba]|uniref:hypothetical protein n=1 Tax=Niallia alba TaxID=2729105 RepID=UPI000C76C257|nr:hypothetical protein [Niallia alba]MED3795255.1 hypothetical protein [Niallia alba]